MRPVGNGRRRQVAQSGQKSFNRNPLRRKCMSGRSYVSSRSANLGVVASGFPKLARSRHPDTRSRVSTVPAHSCLFLLLASHLPHWPIATRLSVVRFLLWERFGPVKESDLGTFQRDQGLGWLSPRGAARTQSRWSDEMRTKAARDEDGRVSPLGDTTYIPIVT